MTYTASKSSKDKALGKNSPGYSLVSNSFGCFSAAITNDQLVPADECYRTSLMKHLVSVCDERERVGMAGGRLSSGALEAISKTTVKRMERNSSSVPRG